MELNSESPGSGGTKPISEEEPMLYCPVCSRRLAERKCKLLCEQCGYYMSCADYY
jgi:Zn finger protein HypA/HybF involved in hydrogenase expression